MYEIFKLLKEREDVSLTITTVVFILMAFAVLIQLFASTIIDIFNLTQPMQSIVYILCGIACGYYTGAVIGEVNNQ